MNPPMNVLEKAEDARPVPVARDIDGSLGPEVAGSRQIEPVRSTGDDTEPGTPRPAGVDAGEPSGREVAVGRELGPVRATRDDTGEGALRPAGREACEPSGSARSRGWPLGPIRAMRDDADPGAPSPAACEGDAPPGFTALDGWGLDPAGAARDSGKPGALWPAAPEVAGPPASFTALGERDLDPAGAARDGVDPGALWPAAPEVDEPPASFTALGERGLDPAGAARDGVDPGALWPAAPEVAGPPSGFTTLGEWGLDPVGAAKDDVDPEVVARGSDFVPPERRSPTGAAPPGAAAKSAGDASGPAGDGARGHGHAMGDLDALAVSSGGPAASSFSPFSPVDEGAAGGEAPARVPSADPDLESVGRGPGDLPPLAIPAESARAVVGEADAAGATGGSVSRAWPGRLDARDPRSTPCRAFDPQALPRRRRVGRAIGIALSFLAVVGAGAGGGYSFWKTWLVPPALVRDLSPMPAVDLTPVHAANAATVATGQSVVGAEARPESRSAAPAPDAAEASLAARAVTGFSVSERPEEFHAPLVAGASASGESVASETFLAPRASSQGESAVSGAAGVSRLRVPEGTARPWAASGAGLSSLVSASGESVASETFLAPRASSQGESAVSGAADVSGLRVPEGTTRPRAASGTGRSSLGEPEGTRASSVDGSPAPASLARDGPASESPGTVPAYRDAVPVLPDRTEHVSASREPEPVEPRLAAPVLDPIIQAVAGASATIAVDPAPAMEHAGAVSHAESDAGIETGIKAAIEIRTRVRTDHVATLLERAYETFRAGDAESAAEAYRAALGHEPRNRDALLGLAAVAAREGRWEEAAGHYARVLASSPGDTVAQAALIAIDEQDPARGERRLKALLWSEPRAAYLHFSLGNVYAAQSRWSEAQRSYLDAHRLDGGNADYAYNLAVSLDHLSQRESALDFYREALALARSRLASFETAAVQARIRDLETSPSEAIVSARPLPEPAGAASAASDR